jgi:pantothenate kinase
VNPSLDSLVALAREQAAGRRRYLIGIAGPPGAGKSTTARALAPLLEAVVVPMDGFHLPNDELRRRGRLEHKGAPDTFDAPGYAALLRRLGAAGADVEVIAPDFDRWRECTVPDAIRVPARTVFVLTEGNYLLLDDGPWSDVRAALDTVWYLDVADEVRVERLVARGMDHGWSAKRARLRATGGSDGENARLVATTRDRADLVVHCE